MHKIVGLKKRKEFLAVSQSGEKWVTKAFVLQIRPWANEESHGDASLRFGITASKKTGNAVRRNRIRRRIRALAKEILPIASNPRYDFVFIARFDAWDKDYTQLKADLYHSLKGLNLLNSKSY
ncbi:MAG: ribonuclease P protein component [Alphaproteobacteria bacterium]